MSATSRAAPRRSATRTSCTPPWSSWSRSTTRRSSTARCRTGIRATPTARAASTTSSPSAAACRGARSKVSWTQVETGSAITWKYPSCILQGEDSVGEFYSVAVTNNRQQADTGTKMIHIGKNTRSTIVSKGISAGRSDNTYRGLVRILPRASGARNFTQCDSLLIGDQCGAHTVPYIESRNPTAKVEHEATTSKIAEDQLFYCRSRGLSQEDAVGLDRQRLLQGRLEGAADGIRGRGAEAARRVAGRVCRLMLSYPQSVCLDRGQADPARDRPRAAAGSGARHHGPERVRQEHARLRAGRQRGL